MRHGQIAPAAQCGRVDRYRRKGDRRHQRGGMGCLCKSAAAILAAEVPRPLLNRRLRMRSLTLLFPTLFSPPLRASKSVGGHSGWLAQHLVLRNADNDRRSCRAVLPEKPFPRRVRFRLRLGGGVRARRRQLLSQAASRSALHSGYRTAVIGTAQRQPGRSSPRARGRSRRTLSHRRGFRRSRHFRG